MVSGQANVHKSINLHNVNDLLDVSQGGWYM